MLTERFSDSIESVFDTFPWPQSVSAKQIEAVAKAGREVRRVRTASAATASSQTTSADNGTRPR